VVSILDVDPQLESLLRGAVTRAAAPLARRDACGVRFSLLGRPGALTNAKWAVGPQAAHAGGTLARA
jgi:hypothetical protein